MDSQLDNIANQVSQIDGWFTKEQMRFLMPYVEKLRDTQIVEIGTYRGRSAMFFALASDPSVRVLTIDPCNYPWPQEPDPAGFKYINAPIDKRVTDTGKVTQWICTSVEATFQFKNNSIDFIFIDGVHEVCAIDILVWYPKVKVGGLMAFHDFDDNHPEVKSSVMQAVKAGELKIIKQGDYMCICEKLAT